MARPTTFPTIRTEGGLLPSDLLSLVAAGSLPGMSPEVDYHLAPHEKLNEAISRSWNRLLAAWGSFKVARTKLVPGDLATTETREKWLLPLFVELGYGRLAPTRAVELDGRNYPISHEWGVVPIHLVGAVVELDQRAHGVAGAARMSPHGLVQELLNASSERLWGVVSNGRQLRLLRDSAAITRQAFLEFDLEEMMDGEVYSDFVVLWLVAHQSRLEGERPSDCWLEKWSEHAIEQGTRVLNRLREGVEAAISVLGSGFLAHPANAELRASLRNGSLNRQSYYRQLLRLVYRLIFLMVAEDRDLLHPPATAPVALKIYAKHYSIGRLRRLAERRRGSAHSDLYVCLTLVMDALGQEGGLPALGLPDLGSFLWRSEAIPNLAFCLLRNRELLQAVLALAFTEDGGIRRGVDYRNLGSEELGSVYESLLELHPVLNLEAATFSLATAGGNERKLTGSYYTPTPLITSLVETALDPVLAEAAATSEPEEAILNLNVVDPACGSGHFLIAAAHRIAKRLASVRTGDAEAAPEAVRAALRDVIGRCIYGVDVNPMAVELCKVSLWIDALDPGRPLSFLDHRIKCGHSLIGATQELSTIGIPDNAFKALDGDDKKWVTSLRNQNKSEASGQTTLRAIATEVASYRSSIAAGLAELDQVDDASSSIVTEKERRYAELLASEAAVRAKAAADAWCAAFVAPKRPDTPSITDEIRRLLADGSPNVPAATRDLVTTLSDQSNFFHWDLAFADVFSERGGFDIVIGNPPWEMIQLDDREFFAVTRPDITDQPNMSARKRALASLQLEDPTLYGEYVRELRRMEGVQQFIHESGRFPLSSFGRLNTAPLFVELAISLLAPTGRCGLITPTGIATDSFNQYLFRKLVDDRRLASLYDFENGDLFPDVDSRFKFCLLTLAGRDRPVENAEFVFFAHQIEDLSLEDRRFTVSPEDFHLFNPNTGTCPIFRTRRDAAITRGIYERVPVLLDKTRAEGNPWQVSFQLMFMMNTDSKLFRTRSELLARGGTLEGNTFQVDGETYLPLYEGKMLHQFDHRAAHVVTSETAILRQGQSAELSLTEHADPNALPIPRYWVDARHVAEKFGDGASPHVLLAIRKVTSPTNERTVIGTLLPFAGVGDSAQVLLTNQSSARAYACLAACMSSFALDFTARAKLGGVNLNFFIMEQLPVLTPDAISGLTPWDLRCTLQDWFVPRVAELYCTAIDMYPLAVDLGYEHAPFRWDDDRRQLIRAEVDAAFFHLYGFTRDDAHYAMDTFPIIRRKDEQAYGEYQTQRLILERYDALAESSRVGEPYTTVLDPPPGDAKMASSFADAMIQ